MTTTRTITLADASDRDLCSVPAKSRAKTFSAQASADQAQIDALKAKHPEAVVARLTVNGKPYAFFTFDAQGRSQFSFNAPKPSGKFKETTSGTYRTKLAPAVRLEIFPYIPQRPEWKEVPWSEAKALSHRHEGFIGFCTCGASRHFFFQEQGNPEVVVVVR